MENAIYINSKRIDFDFMLDIDFINNLLRKTSDDLIFVLPIDTLSLFNDDKNFILINYNQIRFIISDIKINTIYYDYCDDLARIELTAEINYITEEIDDNIVFAFHSTFVFPETVAGNIMTVVELEKYINDIVFYYPEFKDNDDRKYIGVYEDGILKTVIRINHDNIIKTVQELRGFMTQAKLESIYKKLDGEPLVEL